MTRQLRQFASFSLLWTVVYALMIYSFVRRGVAAGALVSVATLFTIALSTAETSWRRHDDQRRVRYSLNLRYTLVTIVASSLGTAVWTLGFQHNGWLFLLIEIGTVVALVGAHLLVDRTRIKGMSRQQLFP